MVYHSVSVAHSLSVCFSLSLTHVNASSRSILRLYLGPTRCRLSCTVCLGYSFCIKSVSKISNYHIRDYYHRIRHPKPILIQLTNALVSSRSPRLLQIPASAITKSNTQKLPRVQNTLASHIQRFQISTHIPYVHYSGLLLISELFLKCVF